VSGKISLLLVDDEQDIRTILKDFLEDEVDEIFEAANGREALEILKVEEVNVIFCDLQMPVMNGLELMRELHKSYPDIGYAIVTAYGERSVWQEALRLGVCDFLDKPFKIEGVLGALEACKEKNRLARVKNLYLRLVIEKCAKQDYRKFVTLSLDEKVKMLEDSLSEVEKRLG